MVEVLVCSGAELVRVLDLGRLSIELSSPVGVLEALALEPMLLVRDRRSGFTLALSWFIIMSACKEVGGGYKLCSQALLVHKMGGWETPAPPDQCLSHHPEVLPIYIQGFI